MSQRPSVDRERIRGFFQRLAEQYHHPARIYLVGGTTLVFERLREQTVDIDLVIEVDSSRHGELLQTIRKLKDSLGVNVKEASPSEFIPLPSGSANRHQFIERFGRVDLYHFDPYSTALSKIERGRTQDYHDVIALLRAGKIEWLKLVSSFQEILPRMGKRSLRQDPKEFERNFRTLEGMWKATES